MKLAIIHDGQIFDVADDIETYQLEKPMCAASIALDIADEIKRIQQYED